MAPMQLADDLSGGDIQGREQRRSAMAFVIVRTATAELVESGPVGE